jgi:hypothetical protein
VAYSSNESGKFEIYVRPFPASPENGKWLVSSGGGYQPLWNRNGKELFYLAPDGKAMSMEIDTTASLRSGTPKPLFTAPILGGRRRPFLPLGCCTGWQALSDRRAGERGSHFAHHSGAELAIVTEEVTD